MKQKEIEQRVDIFFGERKSLGKQDMIDFAAILVEEITGTPVIKTSDYAPYENQDEVLAAMKAHGSMVCYIGSGRCYNIMSIGIDDVTPYDDEAYTFAEMFDAYTWQDGTPFGKKVNDDEPTKKRRYERKRTNDRGLGAGTRLHGSNESSRNNGKQDTPLVGRWSEAFKRLVLF